ncbi:MAG: hypothetical protein U5J95_01925 [Balneolaceae bacterium]|nr:hypothetical protein [Balneolaceae bacterium]
MGSNNNVTQEQLNQLIEDASYLQDEAEALKYVIEEVPYTESPPDDRSIAEKLLIIDHAQLSYYRPILEKGFKNPRPTRLEDFEHFSDTFEVDEEKLEDIQKLLSKIAKHRAGLVNVIKNIPLIDWDKVIYKDNREITLFDFMQQMVRFDRSMLKEIADQVMVYSQDREAQREIESRQKNHQS